MTLGAQIASARLAKGWSIEGLAKELRVSITAAKNWENDRSVPRVDKLRKLEATLAAHLIVTGIPTDTPVVVNDQILSPEVVELARKIATLPKEVSDAIKTIVSFMESPVGARHMRIAAANNEHQDSQDYGAIARQVVAKFVQGGQSAEKRFRPAVEQDLDEIESRYSDKPTERETLINARLGQGQYRKELLMLWDGACAVTGCDVGEVLRASHAKRWCDSNDGERLDPANGLPLIATLDALFDAGLIAFNASGDMLVSPALPEKQRTLLGIPTPLRRQPTKQQAYFLEQHVKAVFRAER